MEIKLIIIMISISYHNAANEKKNLQLKSLKNAVLSFATSQNRSDHSGRYCGRI